ncbi:MAG: hypothetical protein JWO77_546 [Ilumatobacteraceae bacterium]|nr:hypothetical protein [Ilumatobacteraceae bacterium]
MGFFKDLNTLKHQAKALDETSDPGARLSEMSAKLGVLNASMAQQASVMTAAPGAAVRGSVQIVAAAPTTSSINGAPVLELSVLVLAPGRPPIPVTSSVMVPVTSVHLAHAGATLPAQLNMADPTAFVIDWSAAPVPG